MKRFKGTGTVYKVWIEIEEYDVTKEEGVTVPIDLGCSGTFATLAEAEAYAQRLFEAARPGPDDEVEHP